jgi:hypothetical protein
VTPHQDTAIVLAKSDGVCPILTNPSKGSVEFVVAAQLSVMGLSEPGHARLVRMGRHSADGALLSPFSVPRLAEPAFSARDVRA